MAVQPFEVGDRTPEFVIIAFMGHDNNLSAFLERHLDQMARGAGPNIAILAVTDVAFGPAYVREITSDTIRILVELEEIDTGDGEYLGDLLARALVSYPGEPRIAVGFSGHGTGVFKEETANEWSHALTIFSSPVTSRLRAVREDKLVMTAVATLSDWSSNGELSNAEMGRMLRKAFEASGRARPVDLLFFDTCLNGMIEIVTEFAPFAQWVVASQDNEPSAGWHYDKWLSLTGASPPADPETWAAQAVEAMAMAYAGTTSDPVTLSATAAGPDPLPVVERFRDLVAAAAPLGPSGYGHLEWARLQCVAMGNSKVDSYDLRDFAGHLSRRQGHPALTAAADALALAVEGAVPHVTRLNAPTAHGLAFWFPGTRDSLNRDVQTYSQLSFDRQTGWSSYLDRHL